ncbi:hypothetical protein CYMTET_2994 [Cymbomonas tetramitiformis]|uniref:ATP-dependent helicase C-terminal domain-containing protein n=1 Tax=Cymbomonas tetramitiformis TaxID=36881 RepID=A0AAE0H445_9CHLO|nr:hypothetical protein CYMTET_2994 [Cymbomonas tetramitiformis]
MSAHAVDEIVKQKTDCPHIYVRLNSKKARLLIINMSLLFTYLANGLPLIDKHTYLIIDEAHLLTKKADALVNPALPSEFDVNSVQNILEKWKANGVHDIARGVDAGVFEKECGDVHNIAFCQKDLCLHVQTTWYHQDPKEFILGKDKLSSIEYQVMQMKELLDVDRSPDIRHCRNKYIVALKDVIRYEEEKTKEAIIFEIVDRTKKYDDNIKPVKIRFREFADLFVDVQLQKKIYNDQTLAGMLAIASGELRLKYGAVELLERCLTTSEEIIKVLGDMKLVKQATSQIDWMKTNPLVIPNISRGGIKYEASVSLRAEKLHEKLWSPTVDTSGVLVMSATLTNPSALPSAQFDSFKTETGLDKIEQNSINVFVQESSFDRSMVTFHTPYTSYRFNYNLFECQKFAKLRYLQEQCVLIAGIIQGTTKSTIVLCPNLQELEMLRNLLKKKVNDIEHVDFSKEYFKFHKFVQTTKQRAVIYGSEGLSTGVDLPGRIGAVVITRPWNVVWPDVLYRYEVKILRKIHVQKMREYVRRRQTIQAIGRLQRCETDSGGVYLLGDNGDAKIIRDAKYAASALL